jgi:hypothetical protein
MSKLKKVLFILTIPLVFLVGIFTGVIIISIKYDVFLAGCEIGQLPHEKYSIIKLDYPLKKMFQNYYSPSLDFVEYYIPENISAKDALETFEKGFNYFKTANGNIYQCGFYK